LDGVIQRWNATTATTAPSPRRRAGRSAIDLTAGIVEPLAEAERRGTLTRCECS
jgi:hypothetical protein